MVGEGEIHWFSTIHEMKQKKKEATHFYTLNIAKIGDV